MISDKLSVIIPTCDREELLKRCLNALIQDENCLNEVIVINDGNRDVQTTLRSIPGKLPLVLLNGGKKGATHARNLGLKSVTSEYIAFLDDDSIPDSGWAEKIVDLFKRFPRVVAQTGRILRAVPENNLGNAFIPKYRQKIYDSRDLLFRNEEFCNSILHKQGVQITGIPGIANQLSGGNSAIRTDFIKQHGGFDEFFKTLSDREMAYRIYINMGIIAYNSEMIVYHDHDPSFKRAVLRCIRAVPYEKALLSIYPDQVNGKNGKSNSDSSYVKLQVKTSLMEKLYFIFIRSVHKLAWIYCKEPGNDPMVRNNYRNSLKNT